MKRLTIFTLISLFSNILSDFNLNVENKSGMSCLKSELKDYVNKIKSAKDIFEFYNFFDQEKDMQLKKLQPAEDAYIKLINNRFEELKLKSIANYKNKSKNDLNKELKNILDKGISIKEEELKECCKLILAGADVNLQNNLEQTSLTLAAFNGYTGLVRLLIDKNADIATQNKSGWTALIIAAYFGYTELVRLLLDKNVDINIQNKGWTALAIAESKGYNEIVDLLKNKK